MTAQMLNGKNCVITGGAGSVGAATARLFLEEGANVVLVDLEAPDPDKLGLGAFGGRILCVAADVSEVQATAGYIEAAVKRFGEIDVLVSNAGNFGTVAPIERLSG